MFRKEVSDGNPSVCWVLNQEALYRWIFSASASQLPEALGKRRGVKEGEGGRRVSIGKNKEF